jgi:regulator of RNase E activity RraA
MPSIPGFERATAALVSDALDRVGYRAQTLFPGIAPLRPGMRLAGRAVTARVSATDAQPDPPYVTEIRLLDSLEPGDVPVYAVDPDVRAALWGELFSCAAIGRGAVGAVVDGLVRDAAQIAELGFPVFCRGAHPTDTFGRAEVVADRVPVEVGGVTISAGDVVVADADGIVVVPAAAAPEVAALVADKLSKERGAREDLLAGKTLSEVWETWGVL